MQPGNQIIFESIIQATMRYIYIYIFDELERFYY